MRHRPLRKPHFRTRRNDTIDSRKSEQTVRPQKLLLHSVNIRTARSDHVAASVQLDQRARRLVSGLLYLKGRKDISIFETRETMWKPVLREVLELASQLRLSRTSKIENKSLSRAPSIGE